MKVSNNIPISIKIVEGNVPSYINGLTDYDINKR